MTDLLTKPFTSRPELSGYLDSLIQELQNFIHEDNSPAAKDAWREMLRLYHLKVWFDGCSSPTRSQSSSLLRPSSFYQRKAEEVVFNRYLIEEDITWANSGHAIFQRAALVILLLLIFLLQLRGETAQADEIQRKLPPNWREIVDRIEIQEHKEVFDCPVFDVTPTHVIASVQHPKAGMGRFRWAFPRNELPELFQATVTSRDELVVDIRTDAKDQIQGMIVTDVKQGVVDEYLPGIISHEPGDEAGRLHNEALIRARIDPILEEARKWRAENPDDD